jgi:F-type H+-transporting ATPase subunit epsilon
MPKLDIDIVTAERVVYSDKEVDEIIAPGTEGQFAVLPRHAAFLTMLVPGVVVIRKGGEEIEMAISGGFVEVRENRVVVLADAAERAEEVDVERAERARRTAEERLAARGTDVDLARAAMERALARLKVVERRRRRPGGPPRPGAPRPGPGQPAGG